MLSNVFKSKDQLADKHYRNGDFRRAAELYRKAKRFREEADCYIQLRDIDAAVKVLVDHDQAQEAAELLISHDQYREAVALFERAGALRQAAEAARKAKLLSRAGRLFEQAKMFDEAADCFSNAGETDHKLRVLEHQIQWLEKERQGSPAPGIEREIRRVELSRANVLESLGRHGEAARLLSRCGQLTRAAAMFEKAGLHGDAARSYNEAGLFEKALELMEGHLEGIDDELKAEIYLNCSRRSEAAQIFERMNKPDAAAVAYQDDGNWAEAARMWEKAESPSQAAELFLEARLFIDAGRNYLASGDFSQAIKCYLEGDAPALIAETYEQAGQSHKAGIYFAKADLSKDAVRNLLKVEHDLQRPETRREYIHSSLLLVPLLIETGDLEEAEQRFAFLRQTGAKISDPDRLYCQARIAEAKGSFRQAQGYYQRIEGIRRDFRDVLERLQNVRQKASEEPVNLDLEADSGALPPFFDGDDPSDVPSGVFEISGMISLPFSEIENLRLPFTVGEPLADRWWDESTFFEAKDRRDQGRRVLIALFPSSSVTDKEEYFDRALQQSASLRHVGMLKLEEVLRVDDQVALVFEHFSGVNLSRRIKDRRPSPLTTINILTQLCEALAAAHRLGIAHRWISTNTVLVDSEDRVKLVGWGLGDILTKNHFGDVKLSPEQEEGGFVGPAADLYSLGWLAASLLEPSLPAFGKDRPLDTSKVGWASAVAEVIPQAIRDLFLRCLDPDPLRRPQTAELQAVLSSFGLVAGQILAERYEILGDLGRGGMSRVYRARDIKLFREVAIKTVLSSTLGRSHEDEQRLLREVQISLELTHPNIVRVHDIGEFPGGIFVTMEILEGESLETALETAKQMDASRVKVILLGIAAALGEAHRMSIIHRDLKPGNVIVNGDRVKVLDFGIARRNDGSTAVNLTRTGEVIGSPLYMAPEQIQGKPLDGTCDLYALGVIAFTLLSGQEPFLGDNPTAIVLQHVNDPAPPISKFRTDLDPAWESLLQRLLAKKPTDRYQSAEKLTEVLKTLPD